MSTQVEKNTERIERLAHESIPTPPHTLWCPSYCGDDGQRALQRRRPHLHRAGRQRICYHGACSDLPYPDLHPSLRYAYRRRGFISCVHPLGENKHDQAERILSNALLLTLVTQVLTLVPVMILARRYPPSSGG